MGILLRLTDEEKWNLPSPVLSPGRDHVTTGPKKEPLGNMKNPGRTYRRKGDPVRVKTHDFPDEELGKAVPYGACDIAHNEAGVTVGISHDTAEFAVSAIRRWWQELGRQRYPRANRLLIMADSGGSNSPRTRLWRWVLQQFADETGLTIELCHYPPGTSKWNKIEHRLFCHITRNWQGVPLETHEIVVQLIGSTRTAHRQRMGPNDCGQISGRHRLRSGATPRESGNSSS